MRILCHVVSEKTILPLFYWNDLEYRLWFMFVNLRSFCFFLHHEKKETNNLSNISSWFYACSTLHLPTLWNLRLQQTPEISYSELVFYTESCFGKPWLPKKFLIGQLGINRSRNRSIWLLENLANIFHSNLLSISAVDINNPTKLVSFTKHYPTIQNFCW